MTRLARQSGIKQRFRQYLRDSGDSPADRFNISFRTKPFISQDDCLPRHAKVASQRACRRQRNARFEKAAEDRRPNLAEETCLNTLRREVMSIKVGW